MGKNIKNIINEEAFDFLSTNENDQQDAVEEVLRSKDFQTKLVYDLYHNFDDPNIIKDKEIVEQSSNKEELESDGYIDLNIRYILDFNYDYNGHKMPLNIIIEGNDVKYDLDVDTDPGDYLTPSYTDSNLDIAWDDINTRVMYDGTYDVDMEWLYKDKQKTRKFLDKFISDLVTI